MVYNKPVFVVIQPDTVIPFIYFPRKYLASKLVLSNSTQQITAFRIKTNVPTGYLVKPHAGYLLPGASIEINITKQPTNYDHNTVVDDKFLVNAILIEDNMNPALLNDAKCFNDIWKNVPQAKIQGQKIGVELVFDSGVQKQVQHGVAPFEPSQEETLLNLLLATSKPKTSEESIADTESSTPKTGSRGLVMSGWNSVTSSIGLTKGISNGSLDSILSPTLKTPGKTQMFSDDECVKEMKKTLTDNIMELEKKINMLLIDNSLIVKDIRKIKEQILDNETIKKRLLREGVELKKQVHQAKTELEERREKFILEKNNKENEDKKDILCKTSVVPYRTVHLLVFMALSLLLGVIIPV